MQGIMVYACCKIDGDKDTSMWVKRGKISLVKCTLLPTLHGSCRQEGKIDMIVNEDDLRMREPSRIGTVPKKKD